MEKHAEYCLREMDSALRELMTSPTGRRSFVKAMPLLLAACASRKKTRYREGDNSGQEVALTPAEERKMTQEVLPKMRKDYPPVRDPEMQRYVSSLGQKIVRANGLHGRPYSYNFAAVDVGYVNAFALPAGTVFITTPLIAMAESEAELAGVVGHEIGHIQARHTAERMFQAKKSQSKSLWYGLGGAAAGALLGYGVGKLACPPKDKKCLQKAVTYGGGAGALGGLLIQKYAFMQNSQEDELEADRIGFRTSVKAGFDRNHVGKFYSKLLAMEKKRKGGGQILASFADAMSTHPPSQQRVDQMNEMARKAPGRGIVSGPQFAKMRRKAQQLAAQKKGKS